MCSICGPQYGRTRPACYTLHVSDVQDEVTVSSCLKLQAQHKPMIHTLSLQTRVGIPGLDVQPSGESNIRWWYACSDRKRFKQLYTPALGRARFGAETRM